MKRPYLTRFERLLITADTMTGDFIMLRFRWKQFEVSLTKSRVGSVFYKFLRNVMKRLNDL